jgi:hypothetical protein
MPHSSIRPRRVAFIFIALSLVVQTTPSRDASPRAGGQSAERVPDRLIVLIFDQMRPDYIDRFDLRNFQRVRAESRHYPEAYVGHLGSQTVVSHLVISTGLLPKSLPWQDDVVWDRHGTLGVPGAAYETGRLTREQFWALLRPFPPSTYLPWRVRQKTGRKVIAIGEKDYATLLLGTPSADAIVTLAKASGRCTPTGVNVPDYLAANPRFALDCSETYGTGLSTVYALDGSRYVPGRDPAHLGGDTWTADAALEVMAREDWGGLFLTFGGIDKVAHMLGEQDGNGLASVPSAYHLADIARNADAQLGRLLDALKNRDLLERTLIVITADHGGQKNEFYLGNNKYQSCCPLQNSEAKVEPPYWIDHLNQIGKLRTSYQDTSVKIWLADRSPTNRNAVVSGMADMSGLVEIYALGSSNGLWRYERVFSRLDRQTPAFRAWAARHHAELLDSMACEAAPHLVGLLADGFGFGRIGDHGGAQARVQRIPLMIRVPGEGGSVRKGPLRLVDIDAQVTRLMRLEAVTLRAR